MQFSSGNRVLVNVNGTKKNGIFCSKINDKESVVEIDRQRKTISNDAISDIPTMTEEQFKLAKLKEKKESQKDVIQNAVFNKSDSFLKTLESIQAKVTPIQDNQPDYNLNVLLENIDALIEDYNKIENISNSLKALKNFVLNFKSENVIEYEENNQNISIFKHLDICIIKDNITGKETKLPLKTIKGIINN